MKRKYKHPFLKLTLKLKSLLKSSSEVGAGQSKKCSPISSCVLWKVLPRSANYFSMKPSDMLIINSSLQNKNCVF